MAHCPKQKTTESIGSVVRLFMKITPAEIEEILELLAETPPRIASASRGVENARLHFKPDDQSWSANDVLAHLRSCADVWGKSITAMLAEPRPTLPHISPRSWIRKTNYPALEFRASFQAFAGQRREFLAGLKNLAFADWSGAARIEGREHTVFSQARRMALHENKHCEQIEALLK